MRGSAALGLDEYQATTALANPGDASKHAWTTFAGKDDFAANRGNGLIAGKEDATVAYILDVACPIGAVVVEHGRTTHLDAIPNPLLVPILLVHVSRIQNFVVMQLLAAAGTQWFLLRSESTAYALHSAGRATLRPRVYAERLLAPPNDATYDSKLAGRRMSKRTDVRRCFSVATSASSMLSFSVRRMSSLSELTA